MAITGKVNSPHELQMIKEAGARGALTPLASRTTRASLVVTPAGPPPLIDARPVWMFLSFCGSVAFTSVCIVTLLSF